MKNKFFLLIVLSIFLCLGYKPKEPKILIIGDSISLGYFPKVKEALASKALVLHNPGNAQHTGTGLEKIEDWVGEEDWDIIQFNWGLWDLCYRHPDSKVYGNRDKIKGTITYDLETYEKNLEELVSFLKANTSAKLIFVTTTYVPVNEAGRHSTDVAKYNAVAKSVMKKNGVIINDIYKKSITIHRKNGLGDKDVHYNKEGYNDLGKLIVPVLQKTMKKL
ncbi:SGNH/GDSL hydrolase family protein [Arenibacter sp. BSSL-BM3]|uniref:SGNH/GDSL hydrolase family protein n=1 Tax=Arenibacter arenosicollis TaxID=2762274 RepID=A0ABR7QI42_9FLAO|nr:SGNH/GDSL hydrolase family protein [Arenibacter arenosicollis]MBC8766863.1 SGNH/GDSL hydrolase family protein [Arenibacter arenosicollis]